MKKRKKQNSKDKKADIQLFAPSLPGPTQYNRLASLETLSQVVGEHGTLKLSFSVDLLACMK